MSDNIITKNRVYELRTKQKMSQKSLAMETGLHPNTVGDIERNINKKINPEHFEKIAKALGVKYNDLFVLPETEETSNSTSMSKGMEETTFNIYIEATHIKAYTEDLLLRAETLENMLAALPSEIAALLVQQKKQPERKSKSGRRFRSKKY